ncbi:MAG: ANTAR domain-containing protein [Lachnospiraceae bacterium]|nr:ANTAR domain-containing protein [Lachnospiraceae bacterium]
MTNIIVAFPRSEESTGVKNLLVRNGFRVTAVCTTGAQVMSQVDSLNDGIIISGYRLADMMYSELNSYLPEDFEMLLIASRQVLGAGTGGDIMCLSMPLRVQELLQKVSLMVENMERRRRRRKLQPRERNSEELDVILEAKQMIMKRKNITEDEAHRYLQKNSMDSGVNMAEMARMVLTMYQLHA